YDADGNRIRALVNTTLSRPREFCRGSHGAGNLRQADRGPRVSAAKGSFLVDGPKPPRDFDCVSIALPANLRDQPDSENTSPTWRSIRRTNLSFLRARRVPPQDAGPG